MATYYFSILSKYYQKARFMLCLMLILVLSNTMPAQSQNYHASVLSARSLSNIPSASGIVKLNSSYFIIGDDSPYLFQLDSNFQFMRKMAIADTKKVENGRIPNDKKPDFEAAVVAPWGKDSDILVFGSGSIAKKREKLVRIDFDEDKEKIKHYSLRPFYKYISHEADLSKGQLNIEGATLWEKQLILLSRADNNLYFIDYKDFRKYVKDKDKKKPDLEIIPYQLPVINGNTARFSGASLLPGENMLVFSASVENTPDWISDGEILGSYIGLIDLKQTENRVPVCALLKKDDYIYTGKLESVVVTRKTDSYLELAGVCDNDDGSSTLLAIRFERIP